MKRIIFQLSLVLVAFCLSAQNVFAQATPSVSPRPSPTPTATPRSTASPSATPVTGSTEVTILVLLVGAIILGLGLYQRSKRT